MVGSRSSSRVSDIGTGVVLPQAPEKQIYTTWPDMIKHWPKTTLCIVSNEFCERFSYYGMRTVLILYLLNVLKFTDQDSTIFFNGFTVLCYLTPLLGSIIADGYIGKFWTIFSVSIIYAAGQIILAVASTKDYTSSIHPALDMTGLVIIGFGTGGIKPCVSAFGADQFELGQERMLSLYFSMFYFSINAGSMISTFISPIFRSMPCMGQDSCYPLAFGIPAILMIVATGIFMAGSFWYKKPPPKENIFGEVSRLMTHAIGNKWKSKEKKGHWLEYYMNDHDCNSDERCIQLKAEKGHKKACHKKGLIDDTKALLRLIIMFLPVPMFWALYDQQGSVWLIQGIQMDCRISDSLLILPDQMQTLNAVLILIFIPLFQVIIYPLASMCITLTPLRKMVAGGLLASAAFVIAGFVQLSVNTTLPELPGNGQARISVWNQLYHNDDANCNVTVSIDQFGNFTLPVNTTLTDVKKSNEKTFHVTFGGKKANKNSNQVFNLKVDIPFSCSAAARALPKSINVNVTSQKIYYVGINYQGLYVSKADPTKPTDGTGEFSMGIISVIDEGYRGNLALCRVLDKTDKNYHEGHPCNPRRPSDFYWWEIFYNPTNNSDVDADVPLQTTSGPSKLATAYVFKPVKPGKWHLYYVHNTPKDVKYKSYNYTQVDITDAYYEFEYHEQGGVYVLVLQGAYDKSNNATRNQYWNEQKQIFTYQQIWQLVPSNKVNILWQVPQIVVITAAEILFSITGYEFAYSQSAPSMKALVQALWLFTTAIGDSIIVIITIINPFSNAATQFFAYAAIMAAVIGIFALLSIFYYEYHYYTLDEEEDYDDDSSCHSEVDRHLRSPPRSFAVKEMEKDEEDIRF